MGMNDITERLENLETRIVSIEAKINAGSLPVGTRKPGDGINGFLREKSPKTDLDMVLAVAVYYEHSTGNTLFTAADLTDLIKETKWQQPKNINYAIYKNVEKGYFAEKDKEEGGRKRWCVKYSGEEFVDNNLAAKKEEDG